VDDSLYDFRDEVEIRNWAVAGKVLRWKGVFFQTGCDDGLFQQGGEGT
jgi:hypothetical protein